MKANQKRKLRDDDSANTAAAVMSVILLIVGFAVAGLLFTFTQVLGGQTYNLVEDDIDAIGNDTIRNSIKASIISGFSALEQTGDFLPIIVLAVIIFLVLSLVLGFTALGDRTGGGSAL